MPTSSFRADQGRRSDAGKGLSRSHAARRCRTTPIYLRPAGNLHTSAARARAIRALAAELGRDRDRSGDRSRIPQQHGASAHDARVATRDCAPDTAAASPAVESKASRCWATAAASTASSSTYAYSTSRDVGYVVLLNSTHSPEAMRRIAQAGGALPQGRRRAAAKATATVAEATLRKYEGYYHDRQSAQSGDGVHRMAAVGRQHLGQRRSARGEASRSVRRVTLIPVVGRAVSSRRGTRCDARVRRERATA